MATENIQTFPSAGLAIASEERATLLDDLESVITAYQPRVFRFLLATLRDRDAAETLTQETFLRAWTARESFREDCSMATWLMRIALNLARDHTRTGRFKFWKSLTNTAIDVSEIASYLPSHAGTVESRLIAQQQVESILQTVAGLSNRQRSVFVLRFLEEMEIPEIAQVTGLPLGTVKSHLYRAIHAIRTRHSISAPRESK